MKNEIGPVFILFLLGIGATYVSYNAVHSPAFNGIILSQILFIISMFGGICITVFSTSKLIQIVTQKKEASK